MVFVALQKGFFLKKIFFLALHIYIYCVCVLGWGWGTAQGPTVISSGCLEQQQPEDTGL